MESKFNYQALMKEESKGPQIVDVEPFIEEESKGPQIFDVEELLNMDVERQQVYNNTIAAQEFFK